MKVKKSKSTEAIMGALFVMCILVAVLAVVGWVSNIVKFVQCDFEQPYKTEVIRGIGIIPPVGAVIGWMSIGEEENKVEKE